ncbi:protein PRRC2A isoform X1 [Anopheles sinensis]|uniref:Protein PRRC2A isoform X1 n=1 Tax=Anopheles sinensis TaxID=74873 RepID=A0A084WR26_ANOSI|nr:protein PRRC2A isoform X1 [Anopheles sinensis]
MLCVAVLVNGCSVQHETRPVRKIEKSPVRQARTFARVVREKLLLDPYGRGGGRQEFFSRFCSVLVKLLAAIAVPVAGPLWNALGRWLVP